MPHQTAPTILILPFLDTDALQSLEEGRRLRYIRRKVRYAKSLGPARQRPLKGSFHGHSAVSQRSHPGTPKPAVPVTESVTPDAIYCLEDGKPLRSMTRYLRYAFNMTPAQYRAKWGLPDDYPMTAPNHQQ